MRTPRTLAAALLRMALPSMTAAALLFACLAPAAARASETAALTAAFSPYRLGRSTTLKLGLKLGVAGTTEGLPSPVTRFALRIPANLELIGSSLGLAVCESDALLANGSLGCSPNARLGYGSAVIKVPVGPQPVAESANIEAEMGLPVDGEIGVLLYAEAGTPVAAQLIFPGVLFGSGSNSGQSLNTSVPLIPTLPGAPDISMVSMNLSLGPEHLTYYKQVKGRTVGYRPEGIALPSRCPRGGFRFESQIDFLDGSTASATSTVPCPAAHRR